MASLVSKQTTVTILALVVILPTLTSSVSECRNASSLEDILSLNGSGNSNDCTFFSDELCKSPPLCPPDGTSCDECSCLFNHGNCPRDYFNYCLDTYISLGLNCDSGHGPVGYTVAALMEDRENRTVTPCLLGRMCDCLSRQANHPILPTVEEVCRLLCVLPETGSSTLFARTHLNLMGLLNSNTTVCDSVHSQYCRRHTEAGRTTDCARVCVQENSCERLIEGILEDEFESGDFAAALSVMSEFRHESNYAQHVRDVLSIHSSFYNAIEQDSSKAISHLNDANREILMSLFDDLLSENRQQEWAELQEEEEELPGMETLERLETTSDLLQRNLQFRLANLEQLQNFQYTGTNIEMNVECQGPFSTGYEYMFSRDAAIVFPSSEQNSSAGAGNCLRIISAALSSNLGGYITKFNDSTFVNTDVMTVQALDMEGIDPLSYVVLTFPSLNTSSKASNVTCVYWNVNQRQWSTEGLKLISENGTHYTCQSTHLTSFAVLVSVAPIQVTSRAEAFALDMVTYIGLSISIICLILTLVGLVVFRKVLKRGVLFYVHFNLFLALLLALIVFVAGMETATRIRWLCTAVAAALHYLFLSVFCWMLAEGIMLYTLVVKVFNRSLDKWYYLIPLGWGVPVPIVAVSLALRHKYYGTASFCWLSVDKGVVWSFVGPLIVVIVVNTVILILTIGNIIRVKRKATVNMNKKNMVLIVTSVKSTIVLLPLLGITWVIGLFAVSRNTTVFSWVFTILNSLQGLMIFVLHILRNKQVWVRVLKMCGWHSKKSVRKDGFSHTTHEQHISTSMKNDKESHI